MISCDKTKALLTDYLDGTLEPNLKKEVDQHLDSDPECNKIFTESAALQRQIKNLQVLTASTDFDINLRNKIIQSNTLPDRQYSLNKKGLSLAFSGTVLMAALYMFIFTDIGNQTAVDEGIMPSSTIGSGNPGHKLQIPADQPKQAGLEKENVADSLSRVPEVIDDSKIHLAGEEQK
ncbi:MAG: zf-HC2 domain-containing protein [Calditrichae bacterium]|nr:zf-HC2 domain-containing protein [Calditrichia bacterium]